MGWLFSARWPTKQDMVKHLIEPQGCTHTLTGAAGDVAGETKGSFTTVEHSVRGNHLWAVVDCKYPDHPELDVRFIALYLLAYHGGGLDGWGYKDMEESCGPNECDCPLKFLDMTPEPDHNYGWRERVRAWHAGKREKRSIAKGIAAGQRWHMKPGYKSPNGHPIQTVTIREKARQRGSWLVLADDGRVWRIRVNMLERQMGNKEVTASEFFAATPVFAQ